MKKNNSFDWYNDDDWIEIKMNVYDENEYQWLIMI